jgi:UPF0755 protein
LHIVGGFLKGILALGMIAAVIIFGVWVWKATEAVNPIKQNTCTGSQTFTIKPNQTVQEVSDALAAAGLIDNSFFFRARLKLLNAETKLQAGTFVLACNQDYDAIINRLITPNDIAAVHFTVIEGWRLEQIAETLGSSAIVSPTHFLEATTTYTGAVNYINDSDVLAAAGIPHDHGLEGFLFPDTYDAKQDTSGDSTDAVIQVMLTGFEDRLSSLSDSGISGVISDAAKLKVDNKPANLYQVITLASIVQREAAVESEMPEIAQIYWNRMIPGKLGAGVPMYLDADPTLQYALGKPGAWWPQITDTSFASPYNTYNNELLPPGPIANPGLAAIRATLHPSGNDYLYFVAKCDGSGQHYFAKTLEEQSTNQAKCRGR